LVLQYIESQLVSRI